VPTKDGGCDVVRLFVGCAVLLGLAAGAPRCMGADQWGGSLGLTSDYIVRGVSRTNDRPALQGDLHYYSSTSGFVVGLFASNTKFDPEDRTDGELDAYLGFAWTSGLDWSGRILASHYTYPWNPAGSGYDYDEFDVSVVFQEWLSATLAYSPNAWRDLPSGALIGVPNEAAEVGLQRPILGKLSATAGIGYSHLAGPPAPAGYAFWSLGAAYDLAPVSISLSYVKTTAGARALFYNAAGTWRWTGTVIWRF
jgi:uncharacterized protein (TIGR02001 family)